MPEDMAMMSIRAHMAEILTQQQNADRQLAFQLYRASGLITKIFLNLKMWQNILKLMQKSIFVYPNTFWYPNTSLAD